MSTQPECPCKQKLTDGEKNTLSFGLENINRLLQNPNQEAINTVRGLAGNNITALDGVIALAGATTALGALQNPQLNAALPSLQRVRGLMDVQATTVDKFQAECDKFTDPRQLTTIVSTLSIYGDIGCALGIEGLDISVGMNAINSNGQFAINYFVNVNANLEQILNQFTNSNLGTDLQNAVNQLQSGMNSVSEKFAEADKALNDLMNQAQSMRNAAAQFLQDYTTINSLSSLLNQSLDPCFKLSGSITGGLVSQDFINAVGESTPAAGGTSNR